MRKAGGTTTASAGTTTRRARRAETIAADHHAHGYLAMSPLMLLGMTLVCAVAYFVFSQLQIGATEQAVLNIMNSGLTVSPGLTSDQIQAFMNGQMNRDQTIAAFTRSGVNGTVRRRVPVAL